MLACQKQSHPAISQDGSNRSKTGLLCASRHRKHSNSAADAFQRLLRQLSTLCAFQCAQLGFHKKEGLLEQIQEVFFCCSFCYGVEDTPRPNSCCGIHSLLSNTQQLIPKGLLAERQTHGAYMPS